MVKSKSAVKRSYRPRDKDEEQKRSQEILKGGQRKIRVARLSVASNTTLLVLKLIVGIMMGSVSVISEGLHSGMDLLAAAIAAYSVQKSARPADHDHPYGHGKFESLSGSIEALLIFIAAIVIIYEAIRKFVYHEEVHLIQMGILVMLISVVVNIAVSHRLMKVAEEEDSMALRADALHLRMDVWTSAGVLVGLVLIQITKLYILDPIIAIGVAVMIVKAAYDLTKKTFKDLLDERLPSEEEGVIRKILEKHDKLYLEYHNLRTRFSGPERYIDMHMVFTKDMPVDEAHEICTKLEKAIEKELERAHVMIHPEPCDIECDECDHRVSCDEYRKKILESAAAKGKKHPLSDAEIRSIKRTIGRVLKKDERVIAFHKIKVSTHKGKIQIRAHALVDPDTPVRRGHKISHEIKEALDRIYPGCEVHLHFEPYGVESPHHEDDH